MIARQEHLDLAGEKLADVVAAQQIDSDPAHEDFYAWGGALTETIYLLMSACSTLRQQVARYGDHRVLRDDEGMDPYERIGRMQVLLAQLAGLMGGAAVVARSYHSESSHIAVEVDPNQAAN